MKRPTTLSGFVSALVAAATLAATPAMAQENKPNIVFLLTDNLGYGELQKHPEKYRDLVVRVAGFSAFFTKLHEGVQNEIIERTLQSFGQC